MKGELNGKRIYLTMHPTIVDDFVFEEMKPDFMRSTKCRITSLRLGKMHLKLEPCESQG
jgi:hypothetical protein